MDHQAGRGGGINLVWSYLQNISLIMIMIMIMINNDYANLGGILKGELIYLLFRTWKGFNDILDVYR